MKHLKKFISWIKKLVKRFFYWVSTPYREYKETKSIEKELTENQKKIKEGERKIAEYEKRLKEIRDSWPEKARIFYEIYEKAKEIYFSKFTWEEKNNWLTAVGKSYDSIVDRIRYGGFTLNWKEEKDFEKNVCNFMKAMQEKVDLICTGIKEI